MSNESEHLASRIRYALGKYNNENISVIQAVNDAISDLERRNGELEKLLAVAACPQCDGSGAVYGADRAVCCNRPTESGECCNNPIPEQTMEPCQFCEERHALTRTKEQK